MTDTTYCGTAVTQVQLNAITEDVGNIRFEGLEICSKKVL